MHAENDGSLSSHLVLQVYGASAACVRSQRDSIMGVEAGKNVVRSPETGLVLVDPEIYSTAKCGGDLVCPGSTGSGEGELVCLIVIAVLMSVFAIVWAAVMITFSIVTFGGFIRRRYRTLIEIHKENREFLGKLAILLIRNGGVLKYSVGRSYHDNWVRSTFTSFKRMKYIRQASLLLGLIWGIIEIAFKAYTLVDHLFTYDLWPFRYVMILIFAPLILYTPVLEWRFRVAFSDGKDIVEQLIHEEPLFNPDHAMQFSQKPSVVTMPTRIKSPITRFEDFDS
ncbi:MAG: hypothetical protein ACFFED_03400 [Candidatus Thorarchaeota archaeon]